MSGETISETPAPYFSLQSFGLITRNLFTFFWSVTRSVQDVLRNCFFFFNRRTIEVILLNGKSSFFICIAHTCDGEKLIDKLQA